MSRISVICSALLLVVISLSGLAQPATSPDPVKDPITSNDAVFMATYSTQYKLAWANGEIPAKYKELTGVTISVVIRCELCLAHHINMAVRAKAGRKEITEAMRLGLVAGGSPGLTVMESGYAALDAALPP
jgi:AhpD family alkylhydroperoxidase